MYKAISGSPENRKLILHCNFGGVFGYAWCLSAKWEKIVPKEKHVKIKRCTTLYSVCTNHVYR